MLFISFFLFLSCLINAAQQNQFLIGSRPQSEAESSYIFYMPLLKKEERGHAQEINTREAKAIEAITERRATVYFDSNNKIGTFWTQYAQKNNVPHELSEKVLKANDQIKEYRTQNKQPFDITLNKDFLKVLEDFSNGVFNKQTLMEKLASIEYTTNLDHVVMQANADRIKAPVVSAQEVAAKLNSHTKDASIVNQPPLPPSTKVVNKKSTFLIFDSTNNENNQTEITFFKNIQDIENYIEALKINTDTSGTAIKLRLKEKLDQISKSVLYKDKNHLFASDDKVVLYFLKILEDIANENLTRVFTISDRLRKINFFNNQSQIFIGIGDQVPEEIIALRNTQQPPASQNSNENNEKSGWRGWRFVRSMWNKFYIRARGPLAGVLIIATLSVCYYIFHNKTAF